MAQLLLHSASFSGIQSPFWSHHSLCQSIPFSPVWGALSVLLYSVKLVRMGSLVRLICILNPGEARHQRRMRALARRQVGSGGIRAVTPRPCALFTYPQLVRGIRSPARTPHYLEYCFMELYKEGVLVLFLLSQL